ncbi:alpha-2-macroglobulin [Flammeovirga sp. SubArs3]|uniref:alpha-2-macroglobulin family protein n=1 Tax=Flammeovirga sp. SubArs3 TaxID=2995316 RepID=UPI00248CC726|nr:alpha-2-macroglobulin [Flammeovirga sp. SubArs3]
MRRNFIFLCLTLLCFQACNKSSEDSTTTKITYVNFKDEISLKQNLAFTFSEKIREDKVNEWLDESFGYFTITPKVNGKYKWTAKNSLIFSPESGFNPSTQYKLKLSPEAFSKEGLNLEGNELSYSFYTPELSIEESETAWAFGKNNQAVPHVTLKFNYAVSSKEVFEKTTIKAGDKKLKISQYSTGNTDKVVISIDDHNKNNQNTPISITIAQGIKLSKESKGEKAIKVDGFIPKAEELSITSVKGEFEGGENVIIIRSNQSIQTKGIKSLISVSPKIAFEVEKLESGLKLKGDFQAGEEYVVTISKNVKGVFNTTLSEKVKEYVAFGEVTPSIAFLDKNAFYMSSKSEKTVDLKIVNVPRVDIDVYKVYKNNLYSYFDNNQLYQESEYYYSSPSYSKLGDKVFSNHNVYVSDLKSNGHVRTLSLDFLDESRFNGVYVVEVRSSSKRYLVSRKLISISDIGLIAKKGKNNIFVYANSIADATPLPNVNVTLVSSNNQEVYTVKTGNDGIANFLDLDIHTKGFRVEMIYAEKDGDFNYMNFRQTRISTSRFDVGGRYPNSASLMTFIYGDRDLYRPGETVYFKAIVRDQNWDAVADQPIKVKVFLPDGNELFSERATLNSEGSYEGSVKLMDATVTGFYSIEVSTANNVVLASKKVNVEDFMPDRIKVKTKLSKEKYMILDDINLEGTALNLFGPPAANRNYEVDLALSRKYINPKNYSDYDFNLEGNFDLKYNEHLRGGKTDKEGKFTESYKIGKIYDNSGMLNAKLYTTVFDESGRPVRRLNSVLISTQNHYLGIKYGDHYIKTRNRFNVPIIALDPSMNVAQNVSARVELVRHEWHSVMEKTYNNRYRYVSRQKEIKVEEKALKISGKETNYSFFPKESGEYEMRLYLEGSNTYVSRWFYAYGWGSVSSTAFEVDREGRIIIEPEKEIYNIGEKAKVLFKTPFKGKMLVTIEQDEVISHQVIETNNRSASLEIPIVEEHLPNIFVTATLIKGAQDNALPLTVAHGFQPIKVTTKKRNLQLSIEAPKESRSRRSQTIEVQASTEEKDIEVTVAVVDEGILQIKNYKTPNPFDYFYQNRALQVRTYDLYPNIYQFKKQASSFGSDMANLGARANPMTNNRVNLVAFWSGTLKTDSDGKVSFKVDIPEFSGQLRVMAVATKGNSFGSAEKFIKVKDPLVMSTSVPRFLSPKDVNNASIMLANTTKNTVQVKTKVEVSGALSVNAEKLETVSIPANSEKLLYFDLTADNTIGEGKVTVIANALNEDFISETNLNVRPVTALLKSNGSGVLKNSTKKEVNLKEDFIVSSLTGKLILSKSPVIEFAKSLDYLIMYPYGCVEQTTSKVFPQLYLGEISARFDKSDQKANRDYYINEAIRKLQSMQMYSGGLSYWQGGTYVSYWGSVYACHFLMEAKKRGYDVEQKVLNKLWNYISREVKSKKSHTYYLYNANGERIKQTYFDKTSFYGLYVLAEAGKPDVPTMNYFKKNIKSVDNSSKYLLAATYLRTGDMKSFRLLLPSGFGALKGEREFGGSFSSYIRDEALILNALVDTDPQNSQIGVLTKELATAMKGESYLTTQESAFGLMALGKVLSKAKHQDISAKVIVNGKEVGSTTGEDLILSNQVIGNTVNISTTGNGELYYFWELEGVNASGKFKQEDKGLKVRRTYYDRNGNIISSNQFKQNDLIVVEIALQSEKREVENVVVTDMLPAGFEIENPRLGDIPGMSWTKNKASYPQHVDFRDDRVNFFVTANSRQKKFYYVVRAVSKGTFNVGPVSADAMYDASYHSYHGAKKIIID